MLHTVEFPAIDIQTHSGKHNRPSSSLCQVRGPSHQTEGAVQRRPAPMSTAYNQRAIKETTHCTVHIYTDLVQMKGFKKVTFERKKRVFAVHILGFSTI